jgi:hypothetical protein
MLIRNRNDAVTLAVTLVLHSFISNQAFIKSIFDVFQTETISQATEEKLLFR